MGIVFAGEGIKQAAMRRGDHAIKTSLLGVILQLLH